MKLLDDIIQMLGLLLMLNLWWIVPGSVLGSFVLAAAVMIAKGTP